MAPIDPPVPAPRVTVIHDGAPVYLAGARSFPTSHRKLPRRDPLYLELERVPGPVGPTTIAVTHRGMTLGFLSRARAREYAPIMDAIGGRFQVTGGRHDGHVFINLPDAAELARAYALPDNPTPENGASAEEA